MALGQRIAERNVGQRRRIIRLGSASVCGGLVGAILLLVLPAGAFKEIVPVLIGIALVMIIFQPRLARWMAARQLARTPERLVKWIVDFNSAKTLSCIS